jgi:ADP-heptose:LPS heptosyltransferase
VQLAALTLGGDTGLVHLAVAQGRRVVLLLRHHRSGACVPFQHPDWAIVPEDPACNIREITVERVLTETRKVLGPGNQP